MGREIDETLARFFGLDWHNKGVGCGGNEDHLFGGWMELDQAVHLLHFFFAVEK